MLRQPTSRTTIARPDECALLDAPPFTPMLLALGSPEEATLAMRVEELFSFRRTQRSAAIQLFGYQAKEGVWVVVVAFHLSPLPTGSFTGKLYMNPREAQTMTLLSLLAKQERFSFVFFSPHLKVMVAHQAPWTVHHRQEVRLLLAHLQHSSRAHPFPTTQSDPEFARACQEFEQAAAGKALLFPALKNDLGPVSPSRGVVLE
jgi:hypothetical protein